MSQLLRDLVKISPRFRRSASLEADFGTAESLDGYVVSPLALEASARIIAGLSSPEGNRAWSLVGPYGSGKSSFLVFLGSLMTQGPTGEQARQLLSESWASAASQFALEDVPPDVTLLPVLITGEHIDLRVAVLKGLCAAAEGFWSGRGPKPHVVEEMIDLYGRVRRGDDVSDSEVVTWTLKLAEQVKASSKPGDGLCVLIDEMGKLVEWAALKQASSDIYLLQQLAEAAARVKGARVCVVTTLHQSLDAYAEGLPRTVRREWAKVGGRFEVIPYLESPRHVVRLVSGAIRASSELSQSALGKSVRRDALALAEVAGTGATSATAESELPVDALANCAPLHPTVVLTLGPLFRARLGQNERSLFAFLSSQEPYGFQSYLASTALSRDARPYRLDQLYDYALANTGVRVVGADSDRTWAATELALARLPEATTSLDVRVLKCIALLGLAGAGSGLRADRPILALATGEKESVVADVLKRLEAASAIVFRKFKGSYQVWDGSDLDIPSLIAQSRNVVRAQGRLAERLERLFPQYPIVATRHYQRTGTLRHLTPRFVVVPVNLSELPSGDSGDGDLLLVVPDRLEELPNLRVMLSAGKANAALAEAGSTRPRIVALPRHAEQLLDAVLDFFAIDEALRSTPELSSDPVGRRELEDRRLRAQDRVADAIAHAFTSSHDRSPLEWYFRGESVGHETRPSVLASLVCDQAYKAAPVLLNELINRAELSSAAASARRQLMERLFTHRHLERLGIEGSPPELGIYRSVLERTELHSKSGDEWDIIAPKPGSPFAATWATLDRALIEHRSSRLSLADLQAVLAAPPIGLRDGVSGLLLLVYYLSRRNELFLYEDNSFVPSPADDIVQRLLKKPSTFELQRSSLGRGQDPLLVSAAQAIGLPADSTPTVLDVVKHIIGVVLRLSSYAGTTQELTPLARRLRSAVKGARDPMKLLRSQLPEALGLTSERSPQHFTSDDFEQFATSLRAALEELKSLDERLLSRIEQTLRRFFGGSADDADFFVRLLGRAKALRGASFVPMVARNFVDVSAAATRVDPEYFRSVATAVVGKPVTHWTDADAQHFDYRALDVARAFCAAEEMALAVARKPSAEVLPMVRVSVVDSHGKERHGVTSLSSKGKLSGFLSAVERLADEHGVSGDDFAYAVIATMMNRVAAPGSDHEDKAA